MSDSIIAFYSRKSTDHKGRDLETILAYSDSQLEIVHDYIQWLFPLEEPSSVNAFAPLVGNDTKNAFRSESRLRNNLCRACARMLGFYGLWCDGKEGVSKVVSVRVDLKKRLENWLVSANHNHLRLTRILKSLRLLGLGTCSANIYSCLVALAESYPDKINNTTLVYWYESQD